MSWTRICMENSWARVAAIVLMLGLIMPESLRAGVVLEDGEIDSSTVEVGTFAVVIYGQGERQPVSGERESLTTARGYIQAVDAETLTLALEGDHGAKQIALNRIQTLVLIGLHSANKEQPSFPTSANRNNMQDDGEIESAADRVDNAGAVNNRGEEHFQSLTDSVHDASGFQAVPNTLSVRTDSREFEKRIVKKLGVGALMVVPIYGLGYILESASRNPEGNPDGLGAGIVFEFTVLFGYPVAAAIGVSMVDPYDRIFLSLVGSAVGWYVGAILKGGHNYAQDSRWETWSLYICPLAGATIMSEKFRKPPESQRFSVGLKPDAKGHLFAVASLRF